MASRTKPRGKNSSNTANSPKAGKNGASGAAGLDESDVAIKGDHLELFRQMFLIREFELACGENYARGFIRGFLHLYIGQEATGVGAISALGENDYIVSAYRDHGHALARGVDVNRAMA